MEQAYGIFERQVAEITDRPGNAQERLIRFCQGMLDAVREHLDVVRLIYSIYFGTPQGAPHYNLDQFHDRMLEIIGGLIGEGIAAGEFHDHDIRDMTWAVISSLNCAMEEQLCREQPRLDRESLARMLQLVFRGLTRGGEQ